MRIRVRECQDTNDESTSLLEWLNDEPDLRGRVARGPALPAPGEMGAISDVLVATLGGGGAVALGRSVQVWLQQRRADVKVEVERPDGTKVTLDAKRVLDPEAIVKEVLDDKAEGDD